MIKLFVSTVWFLLAAHVVAYSQAPAASLKDIPVCCGVTAAENEFSGIATWRNFVLLIPQFVGEGATRPIIAIDTLTIDSVLQNKLDTIRHYQAFYFDTSFFAVSRAIRDANNTGTPHGGFEGCVAVEDTLFFTIETDSLCFVVKGVLHWRQQKPTVVFCAADMLSLPKPNYRFANAGFESIAYLPKSRKLVAFYENNNLPNQPTGFVFNTNFSGRQPIRFGTPLPFRLTDVYATTDSAGNEVMLGINFLYNDFKNDALLRKTEFDYYLTGDTNKVYTSRQLRDAAAALKGGNLLTDCFSRIISLRLQGDEVYWQEEKMIGYRCQNREGIAAYKKGVLLVVDGKPPGVPCAFSYLQLDTPLQH